MNSTPNPYAPPTAPVSDKSDKTEESGNRASRGSRLGAVLLDGLITCVFIYVPLLGFGGISNVETIATNGRGSVTAFYSGIFHSAAFFPTTIGGLLLLCINLYLLNRYGQSMGKRLVGIRITRTDGSRATLSRIVFLRNLPFYIVGLIPFVGYITNLVDPLCIFGESRKCLHDRLADTIVINA